MPPSRRLPALLLALLSACAPPPASTVRVTPSASAPTVASTAAEPALSSAFFVVARASAPIRLWPVDGALVATAVPDGRRVRLAMAEPTGLRPLPEIERGLENVDTMWRFERLFGAWPGSLWLTFLEPSAPEEADDLGHMRVLRGGDGGWSPVPGIGGAEWILTAWAAGPRCLMGIVIDYGVKPGAVARRAVDCPGRAVPVDALAMPGIFDAGGSPAGDVFLFKGDPQAPSTLRIEILPASSSRPTTTSSLPVRPGMEHPEHESWVHCGAHLGTAAAGPHCRVDVSTRRPGGSPFVGSYLYRFDGRAWIEEHLPVEGWTPALAVTDDGTILVAERSPDTGAGAVVLWLHRPGGSWRRHASAMRGGEHLRNCSPEGIVARSIDDVWLTYDCVHGERETTVVLHNREGREVWSPR